MRRLVLHSIATLSLLSVSATATSDGSSVTGGGDPCEQFKMVIITPSKDIDYKMIIIPVPKDLDRAMVINPCPGSKETSDTGVTLKLIDKAKETNKPFKVPPFKLKNK